MKSYFDYYIDLQPIFGVLVIAYICAWTVILVESHAYLYKHGISHKIRTYISGYLLLHYSYIVQLVGGEHT